ncbi:MAG: hypothetical protein ACRD5G_07455 [Candidatus Acidiferrales bacterium]
MVKRIAAIIFIFICATVAWVALGGTILVRTYEADARLKDRVVSTWGAPHVQQAPRASFDRIVHSRVEQIVDGRKVATTKEETVTEHLALVRTRAQADLAVEHRQKGLLWYSTYAVKFAGEYSFVNHSDAPRTVTFALPFPAQQATYDDVALTVNGRSMEPSYSASSASASASAEVPAGQTALFHLSYRSRGLDRWGYNFGENVSGARDFQLVVATNFKDYDFPDNTLSPTDKQENDGGAQLTWQYKNLVSGVPIAIAMPQ